MGGEGEEEITMAITTCPKPPTKAPTMFGGDPSSVVRIDWGEKLQKEKIPQGGFQRRSQRKRFQMGTKGETQKEKREKEMEIPRRSKRKKKGMSEIVHRSQ